MVNDVLNGPWANRVRSVRPTLAENDAIDASTVASASVLLHGSTTRGVDDAFSDLDLWMLPPTDIPWQFIEFAVAGKSGQVQVESRRDFVARIRRCDFPLIFELRHAVLLQDPDGWGQRVISLARREMSEDVRAAWFAYHYVEMRSEHRGCDNPINRGDAAALLLALTPVLSHAMRAAMVLDGPHRLIHRFAEPDGRVIASSYGSSRRREPAEAVAEHLVAERFEAAGSSKARSSWGVIVTQTAWIDAAPRARPEP